MKMQGFWDKDMMYPKQSIENNLNPTYFLINGDASKLNIFLKK